MARYDTYTRLDDVMTEDLDRGYVGFNNRLRPDQLSSGVLADSKNGRMSLNGEWQTRKGIENLSAPVSTGPVPKVPFFILNEATGYTSSAVGLTSQKLRITVTTDLSATFSLNDEGSVFIDTTSLTGITLASTNYVVKVVSVDSSNIIFEVQNETFSSGSPGGSVSIQTAKLNDNSINAVYGSCVFSNPNDDSDNYIIIAANLKAIAININTPTITYDLAYPTGQVVSGDVDMIQAFNKLYIFRDGETAFVKDLAATNINTNPTLDLVDSGEFTQPTQIVCASGEFALIENRGIVHQSDGVSEGSIISVVGDKTLSGDQTSGLTIGARFTVAKVYEAGSTTDIIAPVTKTLITGGEFDGLYKISVTANGHGKQVGDPITIAGFGDTKIDGKRFVAEVTDVNTLVFYVSQNPSITLDADETLALADGFEFFIDSTKTDSHVTDGESLTSTPVFTRRVSIDLGFTHMPAPKYGVYHQRRLAVPFRYDVDDALNSFTDRKIFDEILVSDILDSDVYDQVYGQFRFNAGMADFNVGMLSFSDDKLVVFNRNSIHQVTGSGDIGNISVQLLTDEVGLIARKSISQVGNTILFLSDNGVYGLTFVDRYNLRGTEMPLSESIDGVIQRINKEHAEKAVSVYFDNRYYIAVPLDSATENNAVLIYNFLNKSWESVDTVEDPNFEFNNLIVGGKGDKKAVYVVNKQGGLHKLDSLDSGKDSVITSIGETNPSSFTVNGVATTRMFTLNSIDRKKWNNFELHIQSGDNNSSNGTLTATTENIDSEPAVDLTPSGDLGTTYGPFKDAEGVEVSGIPKNEDVSIRGRIGNKRAYGLQMTLTSTEGRPRLRSLKVAGSETKRSTSSVQ